MLQKILSETLTQASGVVATLPCQITVLREATTKTGKPYFDLEISDGSASQTLKVWQDSPAFAQCTERKVGECVHLQGRFYRNSFGLNVDELSIRPLSSEESTQLFAGSAERQDRLAQDFAAIQQRVEALKDPRLRELSRSFLRQYGDRFQRAAAARDYHHARRGGLLEHTSQMLRTATALRGIYQDIHWDLVETGILFHDCGKLWENGYEPEGFVSPLSQMGEMLGHISIGIEVINQLWRSLEGSEAFALEGDPSREQVRLHLLHLVASHHGQREFGSPITPRTPEAWMLHYIDNLDAKYEMMRLVYEEKQEIAPGIYEKRRPLEGHPLRPLRPWEPQAAME